MGGVLSFSFYLLYVRFAPVLSFPEHIFHILLQKASSLCLTEQGLRGYNAPAGTSFALFRMAIRFRSTDSARGSVESLRLKMRRRAICSMVAILSALLIILFVCKVIVAAPVEPSFVQYQETIDDQNIDEVTPKEQLVNENTSAPKPPVAPPIVIAAPSSASSDFSIDVSMDEFITDSTSTMGMPAGDGLGDGKYRGSKKGGMGGKEMPESSFMGTFWDLKRTKDGKDSPFGAKNPYASPEVLALESRFYTKFWDVSLFSAYYRAKQKLYSTCFYMPNCLDKEACHAYDPDGKMGLKETRWVALYRARVRAPESGRFRFVGAADSVMAVRFNGENVLACGLHDLNTATMNRWVPDTYPDATKGRELVAYKSCEVWNDMMGGFVAGSSFSVKGGEWYDMQVLISEIGGRGFGFCLLIENLDEDNKKTTKDGKPLLQLFRTAFSSPSAASAYEAMDPSNVDETATTDMPYDDDSAMWEAKPVSPEEKMK